MNDKVIIRDQSDSALSHWREQEKLALELMQIAGELRFDRSIELVLFRKDLYDVRPSQVLDNHLLAKNYGDEAVDVELSLSIAKALLRAKKLAPAKIDIGRLASEWLKVKADFEGIDDFLNQRLGKFSNEENGRIQPKDVVLYGFGRIGRLAARRIVALTGRGEQLRLKAIVLRPKMSNKYQESQKRAALITQRFCTR